MARLCVVFGKPPEQVHVDFSQPTLRITTRLSRPEKLGGNDWFASNDPFARRILAAAQTAKAVGTRSNCSTCRVFMERGFGDYCPRCEVAVMERIVESLVVSLPDVWLACPIAQPIALWEHQARWLAGESVRRNGSALAVQLGAISEPTATAAQPLPSRSQSSPFACASTTARASA